METSIFTDQAVTTFEFLKAESTLKSIEKRQRSGTETDEDRAAYPATLAVYLARRSLLENARTTARLDRLARLATLVSDNDERLDALEMKLNGFDSRINQLSRELQNFFTLKGGHGNA